MAGEAEIVLNNLITSTVKERISTQSITSAGLTNDSPVIEGETCSFYFNGTPSFEELAKLCAALGIQRSDISFVPGKSAYARQQYTISREALGRALQLPSEMELSLKMGVDEAKSRFNTILKKISPERSPRSSRRSSISDDASEASSASSKYSIPAEEDESVVGSDAEENTALSANADDEKIKAALKEAFRQHFISQYKSKSRKDKGGKNVNVALPETFQGDPLNVCFESYYQKMMSGLSKDSKESMRNQLLEGGKVQDKKISKLAQDMSRSLVAVVGNIEANQTAISNDVMKAAAVSLKTDLSTTIDIVNIYQKDLQAIFKSSDPSFNLADAIVNRIMPNIKKPAGNLDYNSIGGLIGFGVIIGVSSELLSRNKLSGKQLENYINAYVNIVSGMVSEFEKAGVPFLEQSKDPSNPKLLINNDVLNELLNASAAIAIRFVNQPVANDDAALKTLGSDLTKRVTKNEELTKYAPSKFSFFNAGGFPNHYTDMEGYAEAKSEIKQAVASAKDQMIPAPVVGWAHKKGQDSPPKSPRQSQSPTVESENKTKKWF